MINYLLPIYTLGSKVPDAVPHCVEYPHKAVIMVLPDGLFGYVLYCVTCEKLVTPHTSHPEVRAQEHVEKRHSN